jgi:hypothetical protein
MRDMRTDMHRFHAAVDYQSRIASLWGLRWNDRDTHHPHDDYAFWAKYGMVICGAPRQSEPLLRQYRAEIKQRNPDQLLLGTAQLMNLHEADNREGVIAPEWLLRRPDGSVLTWWAGQIFTPNIMIDDCLEGLVEMTARRFGILLDEGVIDGLFYDSVEPDPTWLGEIDTNRDGIADQPEGIAPKWAARQALFFDRVRQRWPGVLILANDVTVDAHAIHLHGRLFEGLKLLDKVADGSLTVADALDEFGLWSRQSLQPPITFITMHHPLGKQWWRQGKSSFTKGEDDRVRRDFRRMRLGYGMALLADDFYCYERGTVQWGANFWYAEYDAPLGPPTAAAMKIEKACGSYYLREFVGGVIVLNPSTRPISIRLPRTLYRLRDDEAPRTVIEVDDADDGFRAGPDWQRKNEDGRNYGPSYHHADRPGAEAAWSFSVPQAGRYRLFACIPQLSGLTQSARYALDAEPQQPTVQIDQSLGDNGWTPLFETVLSTGREYTVTTVACQEGMTVADAIRVESVARLHDGAAVNEIDIPPLDAILLLNASATH